jgi:hypothetical protein
MDSTRMAMKKVWKHYFDKKAPEIPKSTATSETVICGEGILIIPYDQKDDGEMFCCTIEMPNVEDEDVHLPWREFKLSDKLGLPLRFGLVQSHVGLPSQPEKGPIPADCLRFDNGIVKYLSIDIDPDSSTFGQFEPATKGAAIIIRWDTERILYVAWLNALSKFAENELEPKLKPVLAREARGELVDREEMVARLVTKEAFRKYFYKMKEELERLTPKVWEGVESPV